MPLNILIYCDDHGVGGAAQATRRLAAGLAGRGHAVTYAQSASDTPWPLECRALGITRIDLPYDTIKHFAAVMDEVRVPANLFTTHKPDLVIFADSLMESTLGAKEAAAFLRIPYLIVKHLVVAAALYTRAPVLHERVRRSIAASAGVITVSEQNRALMVEQFPEEAERVTVIRNSVPDAFFTPHDTGRGAAFRRRHALPEDALVVLTIAAINHRKGFIYQAHLIKTLKEAGLLERFAFVWAGEPDPECFGPLWRDLTAAGCTGHVHAIGFQPDVGMCLDGSDVLLLPSEHEGMPLVVLEAMAKGVPVIASAVGGSSEAIGDAGVLVHDPNRDPNQMIREIAHTLLRWYEQPEERQRVGAAGARRAAAIFRTDGMLDRYEAAIRQAAFAPHDYVSPGLPPVKPDWALPFLTPTPPVGPHARYFDTRFPRLPAYRLDRDEAHILYAAARQFPGDAVAVEVGCSMGWAALHLLAAGVRVDILDPLVAYADVHTAIRGCLPSDSAGRVRLLIGTAPEILDSIARRQGTRWSLFFVDCQREQLPPSSRADVPWERYAADDAVVIFNGLDSPETAACLRRLKDAGWQTRVYLTVNLLGMAWRGRAVPVEHVPDPAMAWPHPAHLTDLGLPPATAVAVAGAGP